MTVSQLTLNHEVLIETETELTQHAHKSTEETKQIKVIKIITNEIFKSAEKCRMHIEVVLLIY